MEKQTRKYFFLLAQQARLGLGHLIVEVSRSHTARLTQPVGLLWTSDRLVARAGYLSNASNTTDVQLCPQWDSKLWSQQTSGCRSMPWDCQATRIGLKIITLGNTRCRDNHRLINEYTIATNVSIVKPTSCTNFSNLLYFGITLCMFQTVFPSIIRSSRLYIQQQVYVRQILLSACASKQTTLAVWHIPVAVCTVSNSWWWMERPSETCRVLFQNKLVLL